MPNEPFTGINPIDNPVDSVQIQPFGSVRLTTPSDYDKYILDKVLSGKGHELKAKFGTTDEDAAAWNEAFGHLTDSAFEEFYNSGELPTHDQLREICRPCICRCNDKKSFMFPFRFEDGYKEMLRRYWERATDLQVLCAAHAKDLDDNLALPLALREAAKHFIRSKGEAMILNFKAIVREKIIDAIMVTGGEQLYTSSPRIYELHVQEVAMSVKIGELNTHLRHWTQENGDLVRQLQGDWELCKSFSAATQSK